jgi:O-antigen/teichoic acid export membrane protein
MTEHTTEPKFGSSLKWQSVNVTAQVVLQLIFIAALARLIPKDAFGIMAIALVVVGFIEIFAQVGIGPALIQYPNVTRNHKKTAFVFSLGLGVIFFVGTFFAAPAIASFYDQPILVEVLRWIALSFIISGASVVPRSMLIKEMRFKSLFFCSSTALVFANLILGLTLALNGWGIWAYVAALLTQNILLGIGYWIAAPSPVGVWINKAAFREMVGYGGRSTLFNMINYAAGKVDTMVVGAQTSNWGDIGLYDRSSYLMGLPVTVLGKLGDSVLFSGMSMMQKELDKLRTTVLAAVHAVSLLVLPLTVLLIVRAEDVTVLILGWDFLDATPIVTILFTCVALRSFIKIGDATMRATDHLKIGAFIKLAFLIAVGVGSWWAMEAANVENVAWAVTIATALQALAIGAWMVFKMKIKGLNLLDRLVPGIILSCFVYYAAFIIQHNINHDLLSSEIVPEVRHAIVISAHILLSALITIPIVLLHPEMIDGGSPELRRNIFGKLKTGKLHARLTR